jgi:hypothetical protein
MCREVVMPQEEVFLEVQDGSDTIRVVKTYDTAFAKESFELMDESALKALAQALNLQGNFEAADIPSDSDEDYGDFLWEEMFDSAREDGQTRSFFVVTRGAGDRVRPLYVSGEWPSAETFEKHLQAEIAE